MSHTTAVVHRRVEETVRIVHLRSIIWNKVTFGVAWKRTAGFSDGQELCLTEEGFDHIADPLSISVSCHNLVRNRNTVWETKHRVHQLGLIIDGGRRQVGCLEALWRIQPRSNSAQGLQRAHGVKHDRGLMRFFGPPGEIDYMNVGEFIRYRRIRYDWATGPTFMAILSIPGPHGRVDLFDVEISGRHTSKLMMQAQALNNGNSGSLLLELALPTGVPSTSMNNLVKGKLTVMAKDIAYPKIKRPCIVGAGNKFHYDPTMTSGGSEVIEMVPGFGLKLPGR